jgi:hypothetical protein
MNGPEAKNPDYSKLNGNPLELLLAMTQLTKSRGGGGIHQVRVHVSNKAIDGTNKCFFLKRQPGLKRGSLSRQDPDCNDFSQGRGNLKRRYAGTRRPAH